MGEEYGIKAKELLKARSRHREARRVLLEMSYRLNMRYRPLVSIGEEVGGVGGAALRNNHVRLQGEMAHDRALSHRVKKIHDKLDSV